MVHNLWLLTVGRLETSPVDFEVGLTFFIRFIGVKLIWVIKLNKYLRITLIIRANWVSQIAYGPYDMGNCLNLWYECPYLFMHQNAHK